MSKIKGNQKEYDSNGRQCRPPKAQPTKKIQIELIIKQQKHGKNE
jgi:hypothetical protein